MAFTIRRLGPGDEAVLALIAEEAPDFDLAGRSTPDPPLSQQEAAAYFADPAVLHWIAEDDGRVVGELLCHHLRLGAQPASEVLLYSIGVRSGERRRGVGTALVDELLGWMRGEGVPSAWVLADNPGAEAFYTACGFERGGPNGQGVLLELELASHGEA